MEKGNSVLENVMSVVFLIVLSLMMYFVGGVTVGLGKIH